MSNPKIIRGEQLIAGMIVFLLLIVSGLTYVAVKMPATQVVYVPTNPTTVNIEVERVEIKSEPLEPEEADPNQVFLWTEEEYDVYWQILLSIYEQETIRGRFLGQYKPLRILKGKQRDAFYQICQETSRDPKLQVCSSAGAIGLMQFKPATWLENRIDVDGDGVANPWSLPDAVASAARYLLRNGYNHSIWQAVCSYAGGNHRGWEVQHYTNVVLRRAARWGAPIEL